MIAPPPMRNFFRWRHCPDTLKFESVMNRFSIAIAAAVSLLVLIGCATKPVAPPPSPARIETLNVFSGEFQGKIEAYADVSGHLANGASQLIEPRQWREGYRLYIEVNEQLPAGEVASDMAAQVPFQRRIPIEITGLAPGVYIVNVNGKEEHLEIDGLGHRPAVDRGQFL